jgi:hypothetical protein
MTISLTCRNGLYYCHTDTYAPDHTPTRTKLNKVYSGDPRPTPTTKARQTKFELWLLRFGSPCKSQLRNLPSCETGTPPKFKWHPFRFVDFKEQAYTRKQPVSKLAECLPKCGTEFYMDFGFMLASTSDYKRPNKDTDRVVLSYDGYSAYLIIVDGASRRLWVFLTQSKEPPLDIVRAFMAKFGIGGGLVRTDQGGELT